MAGPIKRSKEISFTTNILTKKEDGMFLAHCLELDIVAVAPTLKKAKSEIVALICAQIEYAFSNDNLDHLYHPAPPELWQEFYRCKEQVETKHAIRKEFPDKLGIEKLIPPWLITKTCESNNLCYA